jgi:vacuolar-type H+-ATPase subunit F/Vma7
MPEEKNMENSIAIIGEEDIVLGFKALGFKVYALKEPEEAKNALEEVVVEKTAVCLVQDDIYQREASRIRAYQSMPLPVFIPFSRDTQENILQGMLQEIRLRATGTT